MRNWFKYNPDNGMQGYCMNCGEDFHKHEHNNWECDLGDWINFRVWVEYCNELFKEQMTNA